MKRKIFSVIAIAAVAFTSCKKDEAETTELRTATINGNVWADLDESNDVDPNTGLYVQALNPEGVEGMQVTVEVNTMNWDQNPVAGYDYDTKIYTTTTDANGDYTLTIPATEEGYNITIQFEDVYTTKTEYSPSGANITEDVRVSLNNQTEFIYADANLMVKDEASITTLNNQGYEYGTATITGTVYADVDITSDDAGFEIANSASGILAQMIKMVYYDAPYNNGYNNIFEFSIEADGTYELTVTTEALNMGGVGVDWGLQDFQGTQVMDNQAMTADSTRNVIWKAPGGIYNQSQGGITDGEIITGQDIYLTYTTL